MADSNHYMTDSPIFCSNLRNRRNPSNSNYHMSINNCQAIQKSCKDREYNAWFTLGSESRFHTHIPRLCVKARLLITTVFERKKKRTRLTRNSGNLLLYFMNKRWPIQASCFTQKRFMPFFSYHDPSSQSK